MICKCDDDETSRIAMQAMEAPRRRQHPETRGGKGRHCKSNDDAGGGGDTQAQLMNAIKSGAGSLRRVEPSAEPKAFTPRTGRVL